jgi:hypothetical protein
MNGTEASDSMMTLLNQMNTKLDVLLSATTDGSASYGIASSLPDPVPVTAVPPTIDKIGPTIDKITLPSDKITPPVNATKGGATRKKRRYRRKSVS